jgi:unsaturated rhamnogalacturonyl hydrolase
MIAEMENFNKTFTKFFGVFILLIGAPLLMLSCTAQVNVGLDNWFNHETNVKTGMPYHYLWNDTADSGFSHWGEIFTERGAHITTVNRPDSKTLSSIDVYIIVDPDSTAETTSPNYILPEDADIIENWVRQGGVLALLANDGIRCEFTHLNQLTARFGMVFNHVTLHTVINNNFEMGAFTQLPDHPLFKGLKKIFMKEISSLTLTAAAKPVLVENGQIIIAEVQFGKGFVFAVGDPWIYNEYIDHDRLPTDFENRKAAENLTDYLLLQVKHR